MSRYPCPSIRTLETEDLPILEKNFVVKSKGDPEYNNLGPILQSVVPTIEELHQSYALMLSKEELCLIAWLEHKPVGWIHLRWEGDQDLSRIATKIPRATKYQNIPAIYNLWVQSAHRSQGIGRLLVQSAEKYARLKQFSHIGLVVDESNTRAIHFYHSLQFTKTDLGIFETHGTYEKAGHQITFHHGPMFYLIKKL